MRQPESVVEIIAKRYWARWRDWLTAPCTPDDLRWPLGAPNAQTITSQRDQVKNWQRRWRTWADEHPGIRFEQVTLRTTIGEQAVFSHLVINGVEDLAGLHPDTREHWAIAQARWPTLQTFPLPPEHLRPHLNAIIALPEGDFIILIGAATWFRANPSSGLTIRQVPVPGMHTKWLRRHRRLVLALVGRDGAAEPEATDGATEIDDELPATDLDALGLRALPPSIMAILCDPRDRDQVGGLRHVLAPIPEIAVLPVHPQRVLIVENKEAALLVPDQPGLIVVAALGNHLNALTALPWLAGRPLWYWGDLDRAGFTLLSRARVLLPSLRSVLMDLDTLRSFRHLAIPENKTGINPPASTLTSAESHTLDSLALPNRQHDMLEQERIDPAYALSRLTSEGVLGPLPAD